ncbi:MULTISPECIES: sugar kinase [Rhodomicrobium]|uniref:sugar kinase n=1 Tax=Rhodomicrobium TaxID=1068 RepID=UPI000B4C0836|nr:MULTISPECIES: sugar kinase [Rhodomicrobium]
MPDLLCFGEPLYELSSVERNGETLFLPGFGGDTSNCAIAAARQGASAGYLSAVGGDSFGKALIELWTREGVDIGAVRTVPDAPTGLYFITYENGEHRFTFRRKGSAASLITAADLDPAVIQSARILHVSGISQAISDSACDAVFAAIGMARAAGVRVSYDPNLRLSLWPVDRARAVIHAAMAQADIALPGLDDARHLIGIDDPSAVVDFYLNLGPKIVALTMGKSGTLVATPEARELIPAFPVSQVDATGAGDTFDGAFLARLLAGDAVIEAARYANVAAALSTLGWGAVAPMPREADVRAAMQAGRPV